MPVRREIPYNKGLYFITFTCYKWLPLIEITNSYEIVYRWVDYLKTKNYHVVGYVIMPNHIHVMISFSNTEKTINKIIGDRKRFMAYDIIKRLKQKEFKHILEKLAKAVSGIDKKRGKKHEVWEKSFDWKFCETEKFANQKLVYMHNNPCAGKWRLVIDATKYEHSSARFYIIGRHAAYEVKNLELLIVEWLNSGPESATHKATQ